MGTVPALYVPALVVGNVFIIACLAATWLATHRAAVARRWRHMHSQFMQVLAASSTEAAVAPAAGLKSWTAGQPALGHPIDECTEQQHVVSMGAVQLNAEPLEIAWHNMSCTYENNKGEAVPALQSVYGKALPYEVLAILGPSGSGKTTLMDILALRHISGAVTGSITTNGRPVSLKFVQKRAYVPQEHHFAPIITAWEVVYFYASLCGNSDTATTGDAKERAFAALEIMGLSAQANTLVGGTYSTGLSFRGLSGGEKKRLNIACHIVGNPSALFLDEPTSGLDASAALKVMRYMRVLALSGRTVLLTIHQPRAAIWEHIDKVMVMASGNMLYFGEPHGAVPWLTQTLQCAYEANIHGIWSDWVMDLISPVTAANEEEGDAAAGAPGGAAAVGMQGQRGARCDALQVPGGLEAAAATFLKRFLEHEKQAQQQGQGGGGTAELLNGSYHRQQQQQQQQPQLAQVQQTHVNASKAAEHTVPEAAATATASVTLTGVSALELAPSSGSIDAAVADVAAIRRQQRRGCAAGVRGWLSQLRVLLWREIIIVSRNPADAAGRMAAATYVGLVIGLVFVDADHVKPYSALPRIGCMFMSMVTIALLPFVSMSIFVTQRNAFLFDASEDLYSTTAYYTAQALVNSVTSGLNALVFTACVYGLAGLRTNPVTSVFWVLLMLVLLHLIFVQALIWFAMLATSQDVAFAFAIAFTTFNATLGNYVLLWQNMKLSIFQWLRFLSAMYYSTGALVQVEFKDNSAGCTQKGIIVGLTGPTDCQGIGNQVVDAFTHYPLGWTAGILCLYLAVMHMATIGTMLWRVRKQRSHHHTSQQMSWMQVLGHKPQQDA